jgi:ParB family transcriptional regulator, chromosome partitioning protein
VASPARRGLGRGLEALVGGAADEPELAHLPVELIRPNPRQPRRSFDDEAASGLTESVRAEGVLQPVVVRPRPDGTYELIAGERRWRAARAAGNRTVPAIVRETGDRDALVLALVENVAREELSAIEEARAYAVLVDEFRLALGEIASRVGRSKPSVSNRLRLLELPEDVLELIQAGKLGEGHARALLAVPDHDLRRRYARRAVREGLSVRTVERLARNAGALRRPRRASSPVDPALAERVCAAVERLLGRPARLTAGRLEVPFTDEHDLAELAEALERAREVGDPGFEPGTSALSERRSNQLS